MTSNARLELPVVVHNDLMAHLLPRRPKSEEVAFVFCHSVRTAREVRLSFLESYLVPATGFIYKSLFGIELSDACRGSVIKRAHELNASLIEMHSHPLAGTVEFSPSDRNGFSDFVPHVWWRLKQRPYAAIVVGPRGFDSLCWFSNCGRPDCVLELQVAERLITPTGLTLANWEDGNGF
jgi:hypothetical protein